MDYTLYEEPYFYDAPFYRPGMTADEYIREKMYLNENIDSFICGGYTPLWKQAELRRGKNTGRRKREGSYA